VEVSQLPLVRTVETTTRRWRSIAARSGFKRSRTGATKGAGPIDTPWRDRNVRLSPPGGTELMLFSAIE